MVPSQHEALGRHVVDAVAKRVSRRFAVRIQGEDPPGDEARLDEIADGEGGQPERRHDERVHRFSSWYVGRIAGTAAAPTHRSANP